MASPPRGGWGRSGRPVWISPLVEPSNTVFLYMSFCLSLVFSLNMCPRTCLFWMCAVLPFDLISSPPWLWIKRTQKPPLTWGSSMGFLFVLLLCLSPSLFASLSLSHVSFLLVSSLFLCCALTGVQEDVCEKKSKVDKDASGLVPYGGDSSDEEEERTHSSKTDHS